MYLYLERGELHYLRRISLVYSLVYSPGFSLVYSSRSHAAPGCSDTGCTALPRPPSGRASGDEAGLRRRAGARWLLGGDRLKPGRDLGLRSRKAAGGHSGGCRHRGSGERGQATWPPVSRPACERACEAGLGRDTRDARHSLALATRPLRPVDGHRVRVVVLLRVGHHLDRVDRHASVGLWGPAKECVGPPGATERDSASSPGRVAWDRTSYPAPQARRLVLSTRTHGTAAAWEGMSTAVAPVSRRSQLARAGAGVRSTWS